MGVNMSVAGFRTAASAQASGSTAEQETPSYLREFKDLCEGLWDKLRQKDKEETHVIDKNGLDNAEDPYKAFWWRKGLGDQVYDFGDRVTMSGNRKAPVTDKQIMRMVAAAHNRKDPPWETLYCFDKKGKPDLAMAARVENVIAGMRAQGMIPADCKIHACLNKDEYPGNIKKFSNFLSDKLNEAANPAAQAPVAPQAGLRSAAAAPSA